MISIFYCLTYIKRYQSMKLILLLLLIILVHSEFCFSQCSLPVNATCAGSPYLCTTYNTPFSTLNTLSAGYTQVQMTKVSGITTANNFKFSTTFSPFVCPVYYSATTLTYNYDILGKFTSADYIYKRYTITQPHYSIVIRLSMTFIGVWASTDYLNLYTYDGTTAQNFPMRYSCTDSGVNYTEPICSSRVGNKVDCILSYTFTFNHNSSMLLINISSLTGIRDSNIQYWSIFDLNIVTVNCNALCSSCFSSNSASTCTSCVASNFLTLNTCGSCSGGLLQLPNTNPLLGGFCVSSCPSGYYASASACVACSAGCLSCTSSSVCLTTANSTTQDSLWIKLLPLWIILIIVGVLFVFGLLWKCFYEKKDPYEQQQRIISETNQKHADQRMTAQERQPQNDKNVHIQQIDFNDHILVDNGPRKRKRQERDMNRSNVNINY